MLEDHRVVVREREWTDTLGTHYQAKAESRSGRIYKRTITYSRFGGGPSRGKVYDEVRVAAELDAAGRSDPSALTSVDVDENASLHDPEDDDWLYEPIICDD